MEGKEKCVAGFVVSWLCDGGMEEMEVDFKQ